MPTQVGRFLVSIWCFSKSPSGEFMMRRRPSAPISSPGPVLLQPLSSPSRSVNMEVGTPLAQPHTHCRAHAPSVPSPHAVSGHRPNIPTTTGEEISKPSPLPPPKTKDRTATRSNWGRRIGGQRTADRREAGEAINLKMSAPGRPDDREPRSRVVFSRI